MTKSIDRGLTAQRIRQVLHYDPTTGVFRRRVGSGGVKAGSIAGTMDAHGYWIIGVDDVRYRAHCLAWLYVHGKWPNDEIDHRDLVRHHNWIGNLRLAGQSKNNANRRCYKNNECGFKGVYRHQGRWRAMIRKDGKGIHIGVYSSAKAAHAAYVSKSIELFGEFANAGL